MLEKILSKNDCAECKLCCGFFESEIWEVPIIDDDLFKITNEKYEFDLSGGNRIFKISYNEKGLCLCPALGENGCSLGDEKPFDCKIWPFRAMKLGEFTVIGVSPLCKKINEKPLSELREFVINELSAEIKTRGEKYSAQIKEYVYDYPILMVL